MPPIGPDVSPEEILAGASSLEIDSRAVKDGSVFVALRGLHADGHRFIPQAVAAGARVIVMERPIALPHGVRGVVVPDSARMLSKLASAFYGEPAKALLCVGVTGTNGKTTTTSMIAAVLCAAGIPTAVIGTLGASFGDEHWPLENTTPLAHDLHRLLAQLRDRGAKAVAMEVSSHALALRRVSDIAFRVGVLTNVTRDHLDFHETLEAYAAAKRSLFEVADNAVLNHDDSFGVAWAAQIRKPTVTYSLQGGADMIATEIDLRSDGSTFMVAGQAYTLPIPGRFNVANALAALGVARTLDIDAAIAAQGLAQLKPVRGRMEHVGAHGVDVIVDYAHTPDALQNALRTLRETTRGKLVVVFGAGGDRDRGKRPQMGKIAAEIADWVIVTSDNPRSEDPSEIARDIISGIGTRPHQLILDRGEAIYAAIVQANDRDVVLIAGKGHESYQIIGDTTRSFDDRAVAQEALAARAQGSP